MADTDEWSSAQERKFIEMEKEAFKLPEHNANHTRPKGKKHLIHRVVVEGEYAATGGENGRQLQKPYREVFFVDDEQHQKHGAISIWKREGGIGSDRIKKKDPTFVRFLTHYLVECKTNGDAPTDLDLFNRADLLAYIKQYEMPIDVALFPADDLGLLRQGVIDCKQDEKAYLRQQSMIRKRAKARPDYDSLRELNERMLEQEMNGSEQNQLEAAFNARKEVDVLEGVL